MAAVSSISNQKLCNRCNKPEVPPSLHKLCKACESVWYCSFKCLKADREPHTAICQKKAETIAITRGIPELARHIDTVDAYLTQLHTAFQRVLQLESLVLTFKEPTQEAESAFLELVQAKKEHEALYAQLKSRLAHKIDQVVMSTSMVLKNIVPEEDEKQGRRKEILGRLANSAKAVIQHLEKSSPGR